MDLGLAGQITGNMALMWEEWLENSFAPTSPIWGHSSHEAKMHLLGHLFLGVLPGPGGQRYNIGRSVLCLLREWGSRATSKSSGRCSIAVQQDIPHNMCVYISDGVFFFFFSVLLARNENKDCQGGVCVCYEGAMGVAADLKRKLQAGIYCLFSTCRMKSQDR